MRTTNDVTPGIYSVSEIPNCKANDIFVCIDGNYPRFFEVLYFDIYTDNTPLCDCFSDFNSGNYDNYKKYTIYVYLKEVYSVGSIFDDTRDKYIPDRNNSVTDSIISDSGYGIRKLTYNSDGNVTIHINKQSVAKKWDKKPIILESPIKITNFWK